MCLKQELHTILSEYLRSPTVGMSHASFERYVDGRDRQTGVPVEGLLGELKKMAMTSRAELVRELFSGMAKDLQTALVVELSDAVNQR